MRDSSERVRESPQMSNLTTQSRVAILVSANEYDRLTPLYYCHRDSELLKQTLLECCDYEEDHIHTMKLSPGSPPGAAKQQFHASLRAILDGYRSASPRTILFYFAGHGVWRDSQHERCYLALPDSDPRTAISIDQTAVSISEVGDILREKRVPIFRVLDACHAGQYTRSASPLSRLRVDTPNWSTLAACSEHLRARECNRFQHGIFTYFLSDAIRLSQHGDLLFSVLHRAIASKIDAWRRERDLPVADPVHIEWSEGLPAAFASRLTRVKICPISLPYDLRERLGLSAPLQIRRNEQTGEPELAVVPSTLLTFRNRSYVSLPLAHFRKADVVLLAGTTLRLRWYTELTDDHLTVETIYPRATEVHLILSHD